jgi:hypothetical protein
MPKARMPKSAATRHKRSLRLKRHWRVASDFVLAACRPVQILARAVVCYRSRWRFAARNVTARSQRD